MPPRRERSFLGCGPHLHALFKTAAACLDDAHVRELLWAATALELYQEVLHARRVILGDDNRDTLATLHAIERLQSGQTTVPRHFA
jgi:hypothetical protein